MGARRPVLISAAALLVALAGCTGSPSNDAAPGAPASAQNQQFSGVALPTDYSVDNNRSLALGAGDRWIGRVVLTSGMSVDDAFDFYRREMPKYGWSEGAVVRASTNLLTFTSPSTGRVAVVQITNRTISGSYIEMVVSPTSDGSATAMAPSAGSAPQQQAPVTTQPLQ